MNSSVRYIEFYDVISVPMAIALSGQPLLGQPMMVKPSEAEKNLVQSTASVAAGQTGRYAGGARRLYVGNLHLNITEDQLRQVFEPFGSMELFQLPLDESGNCKGVGFVQFARLEDAKNELNLNGQLVTGGRVIKVYQLSLIKLHCTILGQMQLILMMTKVVACLLIDHLAHLSRRSWVAVALHQGLPLSIL